MNVSCILHNILNKLPNLGAIFRPDTYEVFVILCMKGSWSKTTPNFFWVLAEEKTEK